MQLLDKTFELPWKFEDIMEVTHALANLRKNWIKASSDKNSPLYLAWELLRIDPTERLSVEAAEQRLPYLNWTSQADTIPDSIQWTKISLATKL